MRRDWAERERGSLSPLIIGALLIGALMLAVISDSARVFLAHRELVRLSDSTALAAASALDVGVYYSSRSTAVIPLDRERAWQIAQNWVVQNERTNSQLQNVQISSLTVEGGEVNVTLLALVPELFFRPVSGSHFVTITVSAAALSQRK